MKQINEYKKLDSAFDESHFCDKIGNIYFRLKCDVSDGKAEEISPYLTDDFYKKLIDNINSDKSKGRKIFTERITILGSSIKGFEQTGGNDIITAELKCRVVEYYVNSESLKYLSGKKDENFINVTLRLGRRSGLTSVNVKKVTSASCPYCGAPLNLNKTTKCEYCDRIINRDAFDWKIISETIG